MRFGWWRPVRKSDRKTPSVTVENLSDRTRFHASTWSTAAWGGIGDDVEIEGFRRPLCSHTGSDIAPRLSALVITKHLHESITVGPLATKKLRHSRTGVECRESSGRNRWLCDQMRTVHADVDGLNELPSRERASASCRRFSRPCLGSKCPLGKSGLPRRRMLCWSAAR